MDGDLTWGGEHTIQCTDVWWNCGKRKCWNRVLESERAGKILGGESDQKGVRWQNQESVEDES